MSYLQVWITYLHAIFIKWLSYVASSFFILIFCYVCLCGESNYSEKEQKFPTKLPRMNTYNDCYKREKKKKKNSKSWRGVTSMSPTCYLFIAINSLTLDKYYSSLLHIPHQHNRTAITITGDFLPSLDRGPTRSLDQRGPLETGGGPFFRI